MVAIEVGTAAALALVQEHASGAKTKGDPRAAMFLVQRRDEQREREARRRKAKAEARRAETLADMLRDEYEHLKKQGEKEGYNADAARQRLLDLVARAAESR
jgi:flagellar biosynthesis/type III secretory pathway protein FliH